MKKENHTNFDVFPTDEDLLKMSDEQLSALTITKVHFNEKATNVNVESLTF